MSHENDRSHPERTTGQRIELVTKIIVLVTVVLALIVAIVQLQGDKDDAAVLPGVTVAPSQQPPGPTETTAPGQVVPAPVSQPASEAPATAADVYHEGSLTLSSGQGADLDAPPGERQWLALTGSRDKEVKFTSKAAGLSFIETTSAAGFATTPTYQQCLDASDYITGGSVSFNALATRKGFCVLTGDGRTSILTIKNIKGQDSISMDIVTYKGPDDV